MPAPPVWAGLGLDGPVYLRKLRRRNDLATDADTPAGRAAAVAGVVFLCDPNPYSLYFAETPDELHRLCVGYNGGRDSLLSDSDWWPITLSDFAAVGLNPAQTPGATPCHFTNARHYDLPATPDTLINLCGRLLGVGRKQVRVTKGTIRPWVEQATADGCLVVAGSLGCRAAGCVLA